MTLLSLLVVLLIVALIVWAAQTILTALPMPEGVRAILWVIAVLVLVIWLLGVIRNPSLIPRLR